jgi:6-phosphogluconolactonase/glucosamine-6-phosphate isomerase/deaminase
MGVGTILDAKKIVLMSFGEHKAKIVQKAVEGPVTDAVSASTLMLPTYTRLTPADQERVVEAIAAAPRQHREGRPAGTRRAAWVLSTEYSVLS